MSALPTVTVTTLELRYQAIEPVRLPAFPGSTLRGTLGNALRPLVCSTGRDDCRGCPHGASCAYGVLWDGLGPRHADAPRRFGDPQRPYVLLPPWTGEPLELLPGDVLTFGLRLFGLARSTLPAVVLAADHAGQLGFGRGRGRCRLLAVLRHDADGTARAIFDPDERLLGSEVGPAVRVTPTPAGDSDVELRLRLVTPLAIKGTSGFARHFEPEPFTARLCARLQMLAWLYDADETPLEYAALADDARRVKTIDAALWPSSWERVSQCSPSRIDMKGISGELRVGPVTPALHGLWRCAAVLHVGKNATFGFGRVEVSVAAGADG